MPRDLLAGAEALLVRSAPAILKDKATVWGRADTPPRHHTVALRERLPCLFAPLDRDQAQSGADRADLAGRRALVWCGSYEMPKDVQVTVNERPEKWGLVGKVTPLPVDANPPAMYLAELVEQ